MNIHEYQAKALLAKFAVPLLKGGVAYTKDEAMDVARKLGSPVVAVKAQIHAGGRGKGKFKDDPNGKGGVRIAKSIEEVGQYAAAMLGHELVTKQTGPAGKAVKRLYIEDGCDIKRELYLSMLVDRALGRIAIVASSRESTRPSASRPTRAARSPSRSAFPASRSQPSSTWWAASTRPSPSSTAR
jgi:succinyl-CoA synthetase beta subunit